jgi:hypothetical protein
MGHRKKARRQRGLATHPRLLLDVKHHALKMAARFSNDQTMEASGYAPQPRSVPYEGRCIFKYQISSIVYENREIAGLHHEGLVAVRNWRATHCRRPSNACSRDGAFFKSSACECK